MKFDFLLASFLALAYVALVIFGLIFEHKLSREAGLARAVEWRRNSNAMNPISRYLVAPLAIAIYGAYVRPGVAIFLGLICFVGLSAVARLL